jgi:hypothetical protein
MTSASATRATATMERLHEGASDALKGKNLDNMLSQRSE